MPDLTPVSRHLRTYGFFGEDLHTSDHLDPVFDSNQRKSSTVVAIFNLSATIVGGGVLSLPLAFSKCGIVLGTILMVMAAIITERSMYLLCLCARMTGASTYGEVGKAAFGKNMEYFISALLFVFLMFVLVGYMVLLQDIWSDVVEIILQLEAPPNPAFVLLGIVGLMMPFLVQKTLHNLRYNCYIGFVSVSILCLALCHHAITNPLPKPVLLWSHSVDDVLFSFPIIILSFLSIFNILPIQSNLIRPSRGRMLGVIDGSIGACFVLMLVFGLTGYLYAGMETDGNILNNADIHADWIFFVGRFGCGLTIMLAMAMMLLPARAALLEVVDVFINGPPPLVEVEVPSEESPLVPQHDSDKQRYRILSNDSIHYSATLAISATCYLVAIRVPGVAIVWSICGSFMSFIIAFLLPAACYLKIQSDRESSSPVAEKKPMLMCLSWVLVAGSIIASFVCTLHTIARIYNDL